jgi:hypothetical protein
MKEEILLNLVDTDWDATGRQEGRSWHVTLKHPEYAGKQTTLHVDGDRRGAMIDKDTTLLPLRWIERHLRNFALYESWDSMHQALHAGPVKRNQPDVILPLAVGFQAEMWAGEPGFPLPFLQPHLVDASGHTVIDFRATSWSASLKSETARPAVTLLLSSDEIKGRDAAHRYPLKLDLVTHRVTSPRLKGATTIGLLQETLRHVRGTKWMLEELPEWFAKGRSLPEPPPVHT